MSNEIGKIGFGGFMGGRGGGFYGREGCFSPHGFGLQHDTETSRKFHDFTMTFHPIPWPQN